MSGFYNDIGPTDEVAKELARCIILLGNEDSWHLSWIKSIANRSRPYDRAPEWHVRFTGGAPLGSIGIYLDGYGSTVAEALKDARVKAEAI
jgi:hypothetical protein